MVLVAWCAALTAQQGQSVPPASPSLSQRPSGQNADAPGANAKAPLDPKKAQLKADSEALAKAAAELKVLLAKTNENAMSLEVIKKAEEVQRLAKQVQKEMKEK
jgi:hypothetical protein